MRNENVKFKVEGRQEAEILMKLQTEIKVMGKHLSNAFIEAAADECGTVRIGCRRKGTAWWNEYLRKLVDKTKKV